MTSKDEALKMAIEALETSDAIVAEYSGVHFERIQPAINACEEALEQQEVGDAEIRQMINDIEYYQKRVEALEQPAQVTRLEVIDNNGRSYVNWGVDKLEFSYQDDGRTLKIFTNGTGAKPTWQGLSDKEIDKIYYKTFDTWSSEVDVEFGHAIEQALKEKNHG